MRTSDVAKLFCVSAQTVSRWANEGHLPFLATIGGHKRFPLAAVLELRGRLTSLVDKPAAPAPPAPPAQRGVIPRGGPRPPSW